VNFERQGINENEQFGQKLEWIRDLKISFEDKISLLLLLKGIKPVCDIVGDIDATQVGLFSKTEVIETRMKPTDDQIKYLKSVGVNVPESEHPESMKEISTTIAMRQEDLERIRQLRVQLKEIKNSKHPEYFKVHQEIGKLLGYPESCLWREDSTAKNNITIPEYLRPLKQFVFSEDNWEEELKTLEAWYEQIKDLVPKIE
jgi:hypothetical protein